MTKKPIPPLYEILDAALLIEGGDFYSNRVPGYIYPNLNHGSRIREYQKEAFGRFDYYWNDYPNKPQFEPLQILYHMATGSGKTIIMAGLIIYLYQQGYRNFIFFVNSNNILEKTKDNFINKTSSKYLFVDSVSIEGKQIRIKEVDNFQAANQDDINIIFSTIQGLHTKLNTPKECSITYDDFEDRRIVLISDEAHHINAETKKGREAKEIVGDENSLHWEDTVNTIFKKNSGNVLLEFTATVDLENEDIVNKYYDKIIFNYPLINFRQDGYSKEVQVLQADLPPFDRAIQAVLLSQFRRKLFEKHKKNIKPVILFKSKLIKESQQFMAEFIKNIKNLKVEDLEKIQYTRQDKNIQKMFAYMKANNITFENLIMELKEDFSEEKLISVNSDEECREKQLAVNCMEDENNEYRAIFAVNKLNEGWDILNLFDIVRLYDTRDSGKAGAGKTTVSEAQLIGRGARYCPFQITPDQSNYQRKYDSQIEDELRICEELYYHSAKNPKYITDLNKELEKIGIKAKETREQKLTLKKSFKESKFYNEAQIYLNQRADDNSPRNNTPDIETYLKNKLYRYYLRTGYTDTQLLLTGRGKPAVESEQIEIADNDPNEKLILYKEYRLLKSLGQNIIRKAMNRLDFYEFSNLSNYFSNLNSISDFINLMEYLGAIQVDIYVPENQLNGFGQKEKLDVAVAILDEISETIKSNRQKNTPFMKYPLKDKITETTVNYPIEVGGDAEKGVSMSGTKTRLQLDLAKCDWYAFEDCFGTDEEKYFVKFIDEEYNELKTKYDEIYLIRNERHFKIYSTDGRALEPDYVLYLIQKEQVASAIVYQIFIEPKNKKLGQAEKWKENYLKGINHDVLEQLKKDGLELIHESRKYRLWGLPFYTEMETKREFREEFEKEFLGVQSEAHTIPTTYRNQSDPSKAHQTRLTDPN
ncbi:MAG: DEAD/DEAH box helicase family protein [Candidatus Methanoperedens sp.]|nr:DEAD/DEAH box helicase family protein [Candidatus Methanoperedens sp.]